MLKGAGGRKVELVCVLCNQPLAALQLKLLSDEYLGGNLSDTTTAVDYATGANAGRVLSQAEKSAILERDQVVATKCGHMFHQGCLRMHVHQSLDGKGGALFCPTCTKPFAMNRLWPVIVPATKAQRERYDNHRLMKAQNAEMHHQLQDIRSKISEAEKELKKIKEDSEDCLKDIQAKQKLLDSISGPTNKEMAELTKLHMKRQEILHVVTQHNADLLKLLEEESNSNTKHPREADINQNFMPLGKPSLKLETLQQSLAEPPEMELRASRKSSRKLKKKKSGKTNRRKRSRSNKGQRAKEAQHCVNFDDKTQVTMISPVPVHNESSLLGTRGTTTPPMLHTRQKSERRNVDTFVKWEVESLLEPMNERSSISFSNVGRATANSGYNNSYATVNPVAGNKHTFLENLHRHDSLILLSRKPPMKDKGSDDVVGGVRERKGN